MIKQFIEYRETQQLRKDHQKKQKLEYALVVFAILGVLLIAMTAVEIMQPAPPAKPVAVKSQETQEMQEMHEMQDIQAFAAAVTKPLDQLTDEDLALVEAKAGDPCYEENTQLPSELMVKTIKACKQK